MSDAIDPKYLEVFPAWLRSLGEDAAALGTIVESTGSEAVRRNVTVGLNYIFKSLDLIPDGIDDLGYLDDAFAHGRARPPDCVRAFGSGVRLGGGSPRRRPGDALRGPVTFGARRYPKGFPPTARSYTVSLP